MKPVKLTKTVVEKLEKTGERYEIRDTDISGFLVRVGVDGSKSFYLIYRAGKGRGAQKKRLHLGAYPKITVDQARAEAKKKAASVTLGDDPATALKEEKTALSVSSALDAFKEEYVQKLKPNTVAFYEVVIEKHLKPAFGKLRIKALFYSEIAKFHTDMKAKPYMANRCVAVISVFLNWCEDHGYRAQNTNPTKKIKLHKEIKRQNYLTETELTKIGNALAKMEARWHKRKETRTRRRTAEQEIVDVITPQCAAAIRLLMFTGARLNEILSLKWSYINFDAGVATLPDSKTGFKVLQLTAPALTILQNLPRISDFCFPANSKTGHQINLKSSWHHVLDYAGLEGWRLHDLRHAFASMMVNSGASLPIIGKILGHTQASTTQRYAHLQENPAKKAAEDAAAQINIAVNIKPQTAKIINFEK